MVQALVVSYPQSSPDRQGMHASGLSTLNWVVEAIGSQIARYILNCDQDALEGILSQQIEPTAEQAGVLSLLEQLEQSYRSAPDDLPKGNQTAVFCNWLSLHHTNGHITARILRAQTGEQFVSVPPGDELDSSLARLAEGVFPAFLLPDDYPELFQFHRHVNVYLTRAIDGHLHTKQFVAAALRDDTLGMLFENDSQLLGRISGTIYRSIGRAGSIQLRTLPENLLVRAWFALAEDARTPYALASEAIRELRAFRDLIRAKRGFATAMVAFTGVRLPESGEFVVENGSVRATTDQDRKFAPSSLEGQLSGTDSRGVTTTVSYSGDVVLVTRVPFTLRIKEGQLNPTDPWPDDMYPSDELEAMINRLRFSLSLAVEREGRAQLVPTWRCVDDPLVLPLSVSWSDPRQRASFIPLQLTTDELKSWKEWYLRLSQPYVAKIDLALSRVLRAMGERREPSDVLIDSVIAWENLFGTRLGESTFRITMSLAACLGETPEERSILQGRFSKIYGLRSKIVHGSGQLKPTDYPLCQEALDIAIKAIRVLLSERTDILSLPDGAKRSSKLLLDA